MIKHYFKGKGDSQLGGVEELYAIYPYYNDTP